ncbi:hypothetical protein D8Y24_09120 [Agrococcus lahaulensis]|nr:hypothetical protein D8Y24_09120 [Agrococcus lahaulensis]
MDPASGMEDALDRRDVLTRPVDERRFAGMHLIDVHREICLGKGITGAVETMHFALMVRRDCVEDDRHLSPQELKQAVSAKVLVE